ncbi:phage head closure protein [Fulvimarina sp. MAC3]|uniref:phage head closure protein n=1 Tax=Fulvimarina sp. MAC3 TaxID=3148887 RepID=UPI0031FD7C25
MARTLFVDPGLMRDLAVLEELTETSDGMGGAQVDWAPLRSLSIRVEPVSARRFERFEQAQADIRLRVFCRKVEEVRRGCRFRLDQRLLFVESVHDPDESGRYLLCLCREETG